MAITNRATKETIYEDRLRLKPEVWAREYCWELYDDRLNEVFEPRLWAMTKGELIEERLLYGEMTAAYRERQKKREIILYIIYELHDAHFMWEEFTAYMVSIYTS